MPAISDKRWKIACKVGPKELSKLSAKMRDEARQLLESRIELYVRYPHLKQPSTPTATRDELVRLQTLAADLAAGLQAIDFETTMTLVDIGSPMQKRDALTLLREYQERRLPAFAHWLQAAADAADEKVDRRKRGPEAGSQGHRRRRLEGSYKGNDLDWLVRQCDLVLRSYGYGEKWRTNHGEPVAANFVRLIANAAAKATGESLFTRGQIESAMKRVSKGREKLKPRTALASATVSLKEDGKEKVVPMQEHPLYDILARQTRRRPVE
jgi:hypothetical protein